MSGDQGRGWTRRQWWGATAVVMLVQVLAVTWLVRPAIPPSPRPAFATRVSLLSPAESESSLSSSLYDPALFALPSRAGFSGDAWLKYRLLPPTPQDRAVTPEWLRLSAASLGNGLGRYVATNGISPPLLVDEPLPPVLRIETSFVGEPVAPVSRLRIDGELSARTILSPIALPSWPHTEIVSNSVVRAAVDAAGWTFSATLLSSSGLAAADENALRFVEQLRMSPLVGAGDGVPRRDQLSWGTLVFLWHTAPVAPTNPAAALP